eukprot:PhF_6_TR36645/c0_g1_i1/m.54052/K22066/BOLA1; BolA-like protein 1
MEQEYNEGPVRAAIIEKLTETFSPVYLIVANESHRHKVPPLSETHFKVTIVSSIFEKVSLVQRHRKVNECLKGFFEGGEGENQLGHVHALSLNTRTEEEWIESGGHIPPTPACVKK